MFFDPNLRKELIAALDRQTVQFKRSADSLDGIETSQKDALALMGRIVEAQELIAETILKLYKKLTEISKPLPASLVVISETGSMLNFKIVPDWATADADVVSAEVSVAIDGASPISVLVARDGEATDPGFAGPDGASVVVSVVYIDDATPTPNRSEQTDATYTLSDTIAPAAPGAPVLTVTSET